jgi:hypothetical protein
MQRYGMAVSEAAKPMQLSKRIEALRTASPCASRDAIGRLDVAKVTVALIEEVEVWDTRRRLRHSSASPHVHRCRHARHLALSHAHPSCSQRSTMVTIGDLWQPDTQYGLGSVVVYDSAWARRSP